MASRIHIDRWRACEDTDCRCPNLHPLTGPNLIDGACRSCSWGRAAVRSARARGEVVLEHDMIVWADQFYDDLTT